MGVRWITGVSGTGKSTLVRHLVGLTAGGDTIRARLATRGPDDFGATADELALVLGWNPQMEPMYRQRGAAIVDATAPLEAVAATILTTTR